MVKLHTDSNTYGHSYDRYIYWRYKPDGSCILFKYDGFKYPNRKPSCLEFEMKYKGQDCPGNTYEQEDAVEITREEWFEKLQIVKRIIKGIRI